MHINIIIIQITTIKYDITLTTLSFFIFSNVLPHDMTKNPVKFSFASQIFFWKTLKHLQKMAAEHFFAKAWSLRFERFLKKIRDFLKNLLLIVNGLEAFLPTDYPWMSLDKFMQFVQC